MPDLKLFVWPETLSSYTCGIMFALAHDEAEAKKLIMDQSRADEEGRPGEGSVIEERDFEGKPAEVYTAPKGFYVYGGG